MTRTMEHRNGTLIRDLAGVLTLTIALAATSVVPVVAADGDDLDERSDTVVTVLPDEGLVRFKSKTTLTNKAKPVVTRGPCKNGRGRCKITTTWHFRGWGAIWVPGAATDVVVGGPKVKVQPAKEHGSGYSYAVRFPKLLNKKGKKQVVTSSFDLPAGDAESVAPTRIEDGYIHLCWFGQLGDTGTVKAVLPAGYEAVVYAGKAKIEKSAKATTLRSPGKKDPGEFAACAEAYLPERMEHAFVTGDSGSSLVKVIGWPGDTEWNQAVVGEAQVALPFLEAALGPLPGGEVTFREGARQARYYNDGDRLPIDGTYVLVEDGVSPGAVSVRLVRSWLEASKVSAPWLHEGLSMWLGLRAVEGPSCPDPDPLMDLSGEQKPALDDWLTVPPQADAATVAGAAWQSLTACRIVEAGAAAIGDEAMVELTAELISAPVPVDGSHWLAAVSRDLPEGLDLVAQRMEAAGLEL